MHSRNVLLQGNTQSSIYFLIRSVLKLQQEKFCSNELSSQNITLPLTPLLFEPKTVQNNRQAFTDLVDKNS